jgi:hypothetical protein
MSHKCLSQYRTCTLQHNLDASTSVVPIQMVQTISLLPTSTLRLRRRNDKGTTHIVVEVHPGENILKLGQRESYRNIDALGFSLTFFK